MEPQQHKQHTCSQHIAFLLTVTLICNHFRLCWFFKCTPSASASLIWIKCQTMSHYSVCVCVLCNSVSAQMLVYQLPCFCKTNSHTSSRLRLTLWCCWPSLTPFVSLPASDIAISLCLFYQCWSVPLQLCLHLNSLTMGPWGKPHTHTQTHMCSQHDTYVQRLLCLDMLVAISVTSHCAQHIQQLSKWGL